MSKTVDFKKVKKGDKDIIEETVVITTVTEVNISSLLRNKVTLESAISVSLDKLTGMQVQLANLDAKILLLKGV